VKEIKISRRGKELDFFQGREESLEVKFFYIIGPDALHYE
jgi:hypothetical protein